MLDAISKNGPSEINETVADWNLPLNARRISQLREIFDKPLVSPEDEHEAERLYRIHAKDPVIGETFSTLTESDNAELPAIRNALRLEDQATHSDSTYLLKRAVYPVIAIATNPDGAMRPVSKAELKQHEYCFTHGSRASIAIGNVLLAYFSPEVTDTWNAILRLHKGKRSIAATPVQLLVLANLPGSQEAYLQGRLLTQLLKENGISSAPSLEQA